jgi:hypothetical protein
MLKSPRFTVAGIRLTSPARNMSRIDKKCGRNHHGEFYNWLSLRDKTKSSLYERRDLTKLRVCERIKINSRYDAPAVSRATDQSAGLLFSRRTREKESLLFRRESRKTVSLYAIMTGSCCLLTSRVPLV